MKLDKRVHWRYVQVNRHLADALDVTIKVDFTKLNPRARALLRTALRRRMCQYYSGVTAIAWELIWTMEGIGHLPRMYRHSYNDGKWYIAMPVALYRCNDTQLNTVAEVNQALICISNLHATSRGFNPTYSGLSEYYANSSLMTGCVAGFTSVKHLIERLDPLLDIHQAQTGIDWAALEQKYLGGSDG